MFPCAEWDGSSWRSHSARGLAWLNRFEAVATAIQAAGGGHVAQLGVARRASDGSVSSLTVAVTIEMKPDAL
jgi:hypothetical protein